MILWSLGALVLALAVLGGALQLAIWRNGPAVLDAIDRIAGGTRGVLRLAQAQYGPAAAQQVIAYGPASAKHAGEAGLPVMLFVHGGSWNSGNPADYGFVARALVPEGFVVVLAGYRLYPEAVYPAMLEDTADAIAWTRANAAALGGDPQRILLIGHSAGAYNTVMTALDPRWLARDGLRPADLAAVVGIAGPYDFYPYTSDATRASFGGAPDAEATQPLGFVSGDAPPMLLIHGEEDRLVKPRNSRVLAARIVQEGGGAVLKLFPHMSHNDPLVALAAPWRRDRKVLGPIVEFAREVTTSVPVQAESR